MKSFRFVLPASMAAALHAALLWAEFGGGRPSPVAETTAPIVEIRDLRWTEPPEMPEERVADAAALPGSATARVGLSEEWAKFDRGLSEMATVTLAKYDRVTLTERILPLPPGGPGEGGDGWGGPGTLPGVGDLDRVPRALVQVRPDYPYHLRREGAGGTVWVTLVVTRDGAVGDAYVTDSTQRELEEPTLRAVRRWRFEPGRRLGRPVSFRMSVPVRFTVGAD